MAQKFNPATGQWEDDTTTSTGGDPTTTFQLPASAGTGDPPASSPSFAGDTKGIAVGGPATADPSLLGPNFSGPTPASFGGAPTTADQVPVPSVNPGVVYTDASGRGYTPDQLYANRNTLLQDPSNARIRDILPQYGYGAAAPAPAAGGVASGGTGATTAPGAAVLPANPFNDQVRQILMERLNAAGQPVDPNSPEIAATMSAASDAGSRASDAERTALAERLYAQGGGLNTNALTQQIQQSGEKQASTLSTLKSQLLMNEYNQKRAELQNDLSLAIQSGDAESARQAQIAIANLSAAVQREGLGVNLAEFSGQLNQNAALAGLRG